MTDLRPVTLDDLLVYQSAPKSDVAGVQLVVQREATIPDVAAVVKGLGASLRFVCVDDDALTQGRPCLDESDRSHKRMDYGGHDDCWYALVWKQV